MSVMCSTVKGNVVEMAQIVLEVKGLLKYVKRKKEAGSGTDC